MSSYHPTTTERGRNRSRIDRERDLKPSERSQNNNNNTLTNSRTYPELDSTNSQSEFELISDVEDSISPVIQLDSRGRERSQGFQRGRNNTNHLDAHATRSRGERNSNRESLALGSIGSRLRTTTFDLDFDEEAEEGDAENSAGENARDSRGRGRTRKREEDPVIKRSMLEDALRSSLVTLLAFSPHQSQSFASLTTLFSPTIVSPMIISPASASRPLSRNGTFTSVLSALGGLQEEEEEEKIMEYRDDEEDRIEEYMRKEWEEETSSAESIVQVDLSSSSESIFSSADGTEVASNSYSDTKNTSYPHSRGIPIASTSYLEPAGSNSLPNPTTFKFSPTTSRTLGTSTNPSDSPLGWSQRRRRRRSVSTLGNSSSRGRARSVSPGPASNEERFRAREKAKERMMTDVEDAKVEVVRDEEFQELVGAALNFMNMSTRTTCSSITSTSTITGKTNNTRQQNPESVIDAFSTSSSSNSQAPSNSTPGGLSKLSQMILEENNLSNLPTASTLQFISTPYTLSIPSTASLPLSDPYPIDLPFSSEEIEFSDNEEGLERKKLLGNEEELQAEQEGEAIGLFQKGWKTFSRWWERSFEFVKVWHLLRVTSVVACVGLGAGPIIQAATHLMSSFPSLVS